ncbi:hypothetical protein [Chromobacterium violaceum]|uniref:hypothetical protein n=1 Tax=Chromobacterium violaceum TaxID=536 RepID=UPI003DA81C18
MRSFAKPRRCAAWGAVACLVAGHAMAAPSLNESGPEAAAALSRLYDQSVEDCGGEYAAPHCSGVLFKPGAAGLPAWLPGAAERLTHGVGALFLRRDLGRADAGYGMVWGHSSGERVAPLHAACVWPYAVGTSDSRDDYGCGKVSATPAQRPDTDSSSCFGLGVMDRAQWLAAYDSTGTQPCSLSALVAGRFADAMHLNKLGRIKQAPQLWFRDWPAPDKLPVMAFAYWKGSEAGKEKAVDDRDDFVAESGRLLPVLEFDPSSPGQTFIFHAADNPEGARAGSRAERVAARLQRRFDDTSPRCPDGGPAWLCSGLIMRATANYPFTPNPNNPIASFSYLRKDAGTVNMFKHQGIILKPTPDLMERMACLYPMDADSWATHGRIAGHYYCNTPLLSPHDEAHGDYSSCHAAGIAAQGLSGKEMSSRFHAKYSSDRDAQCSFSVRDPSQFYAGILATVYNKAYFGWLDWNELILKPWKSEADVPEIEAFFYFKGDSGAKSLATSYVGKYKRLTGRDVPALAVDFPHDRIEFEK